MSGNRKRTMVRSDGLMEGERYVIATTFPTPLAAPGTRFQVSHDVSAPSVVQDEGKLRRIVDVDARHAYVRFYLAEFVGHQAGGPTFRPVLRLRISRLDRDEAPECAECPGMDEVSAFLRKEMPTLGPELSPTP